MHSFRLPSYYILDLSVPYWVLGMTIIKIEGLQTQAPKIGVGIFVGYFCINLFFGPNFALAVITTAAIATDNSATEAPVPNSGIA